jgi:anti-sigma B factor antagonist
MIIITQPEPGGCTIRLKGELDASTSLEVYNALEEACKAGQKYIKINCRELKYISSAGLGVFLSHLPQFKITGTTLVVYHVNAKIMSVFRILGIDNIIPIRKNAREAQEYVDSSTGMVADKAP